MFHPMLTKSPKPSHTGVRQYAANRFLASGIFRQAASTALLNRDFDNRSLACIFFVGICPVLVIVIKSGVEVNLPKLTRRQDEICICL